MAAKKKKTIKLLVLDALKPHKPNIVDLGTTLAKANGIENVDISVYAVDEKTESVKIVLEGDNLNFETIRKEVEDFGAVIHSVDKVAVGNGICSYQLHDLPHGLRQV